MNRNVEIKARVDDLDAIEARVMELADEGPHLLEQKDTFFACSQGRLKLRRVAGTTGAELIYYERPDTAGPKQSRYVLHRTGDPDGLLSILAQACGTAGVIRKRRTLYLIGRTRVHLDRVEALGDFVELEVVLGPEQRTEDRIAVTRALMAELGIGTEQLIDKAYVELI